VFTHTFGRGYCGAVIARQRPFISAYSNFHVISLEGQGEAKSVWFKMTHFYIHHTFLSNFSFGSNISFIRLSDCLSCPSICVCDTDVHTLGRYLPKTTQISNCEVSWGSGVCVSRYVPFTSEVSEPGNDVTPGVDRAPVKSGRPAVLLCFEQNVRGDRQTDRQSPGRKPETAIGRVIPFFSPSFEEN